MPTDHSVIKDKSIPAQTLTSLETGVKQLGESKIARSPVTFADAPLLRKPIASTVTRISKLYRLHQSQLVGV